MLAQSRSDFRLHHVRLSS